MFVLHRLDEEPHDLRAGEGAGLVQRALLLVVRPPDVGPHTEQEPHTLGVTVHAGQAQGGDVLLVPQVQQGGGVAAQLVRGGGVASHAGVVQGGQAVLVFQVEVSPLPHQQSYSRVNVITIITTITTITNIILGYLEPGSEVEGSETARRGDVDVPSSVEEQLQDIQTVLPGRVVQGGDLSESKQIISPHYFPTNKFSNSSK